MNLTGQCRREWGYVLGHNVWHALQAAFVTQDMPCPQLEEAQPGSQARSRFYGAHAVCAALVDLYQGMQTPVPHPSCPHILTMVASVTWPSTHGARIPVSPC